MLLSSCCAVIFGVQGRGRRTGQGPTIAPHPTTNGHSESMATTMMNSVTPIVNGAESKGTITKASSLAPPTSRVTASPWFPFPVAYFCQVGSCTC